MELSRPCPIKCKFLMQKSTFHLMLTAAVMPYTAMDVHTVQTAKQRLPSGDL
jgi:hypothetical protein